MDLTYGEKYLKSLILINDTSIDDCFAFELPVLQVHANNDGQHFIQLFGITKEEPTLKFILYLNFKSVNFKPGANNEAKKILDIVYIQRANSGLKFDASHENFIRYLAGAFKINSLSSFEMKKEIEFKYVCLSNNLITLKDFFTHKVELKLFHDNPYYELYVNIDFVNKRVEFKEKDEEYRPEIIKSFLAAG